MSLIRRWAGGLGVLLLIASVQPATAAAVWGSFDATRINYAGGCLTCSAHDTLRGIITAQGGTIGAAAPTLSAAYLSGIDVFYTSLLSETTGSLSAAEQTALQGWVAGGGTLIVSADVFPIAAYDSFTSVYGVSYTPVTNTGIAQTVAAHALTAGVSDLAYFLAATMTDSFTEGLLLATNTSGAAFMRVFEVATGFTGGGRILAFGDHNMLTDSFIGIEDNSRFASNMASWANASHAVPAPGSLVLVLGGLAALAQMRRRRG